MAMADQGEVCTFFRRPSKNPTKLRKRKTTESSGSESDEEQKPSSQKTKKPPNPNTSNLHILFFHFESSKEIQTHHDRCATSTLETETDFSRDAGAIRERVLKQAENAALKEGKSKTRSESEEKLYKGIHGYKDYKAGFRREHTVAGEKAGGAHGQLRASAHIRSSARFDYQPDICKDYKDTGYCRFGGSCKFMHDRGDYKSGWQMEKEWEEKEKARKRGLAMGGGGEEGEGDDDDEDALPFACFICRQPFGDQVVTKCKHYFCEHCALKHHSKNKKCFVCNKPTLGIFNAAHEISKRKAQEK